jgi:hypothetical protein
LHPKAYTIVFVVLRPSAEQNADLPYCPCGNRMSLVAQTYSRIGQATLLGVRIFLPTAPQRRRGTDRRSHPHDHRTSSLVAWRSRSLIRGLRVPLERQE